MDTEPKKNSNKRYLGNQRKVMISKVSQAKIVDYLRDVYINGKTRVTAYAENIDPSIYELRPTEIQAKLDWLPTGRPDFAELKEMVLSEENERMLRRSGLMQQKAMELLVSTVDAAQRMVQEEDADAKTVAAAAGVIKTLMPAFETIASTNKDTGASQTQRKSRAQKVIN